MGGKVLDLKTDKLIKEIRDEYKDKLKAEVKTEVVIHMLKRGRSTLEEIAADTDLTLEQVKKIKEEQQL